MEKTAHAPTQGFHYSEDVKEALGYSLKLAKKEFPATRFEQVPHRYVLFGLLQNNRLFTRLDSVLKNAGLSPGRLLKRLKEQMNSPERIAGIPEGAEESMHLLVAAQQAAPNAIEPEHVLNALLQSPDPLVKETLIASGLTEVSLHAAILKANQKKHFSSLLFIVREVVEVVSE